MLPVHRSAPSDAPHGYCPLMLSILVALSVAACGTTPAHGPLEGKKQEQRLALVKDCLRYPERYGFPYTWEAYVEAHHAVGNWVPNLHAYCHRTGSSLVR